MRLQLVEPHILLIKNNDWTRDWITPAFFVFLAALWHFLAFPLIFETDDSFSYYFTHAIVLMLFILNWPITETATIDKNRNSVIMRRKLFLRTTEYTTSLDSVKELTIETYKQRKRLALVYGDGMHFPLSTHFFPTKIITDSLIAELRAFLGLKQKATVSKQQHEVGESPSPNAEVSSGESSESDLDLNDEYYEEDGQINWDKAIDDWEAGVKERKAFRS